MKRRFIPARAGNRTLFIVPPTARSVHPRTCGEQICALARLPYPRGSSPHVRGTGLTKKGCSEGYGSSPHVRGTASAIQCPQNRTRFIPARAGNSVGNHAISCIISVHPRTCGEQMQGSIPARNWCGSSPHVRGTDLSLPA